MVGALLLLVTFNVSGKDGSEQNFLGESLCLCQLEDVLIEVECLMHVNLVEDNREAISLLEHTFPEDCLGETRSNEQELVPSLDAGLDRVLLCICFAWLPLANSLLPVMLDILEIKLLKHHNVDNILAELCELIAEVSKVLASLVGVAENKRIDNLI